MRSLSRICNRLCQDVQGLPPSAILEAFSATIGDEGSGPPEAPAAWRPAADSRFGAVKGPKPTEGAA